MSQRSCPPRMPPNWLLQKSPRPMNRSDHGFHGCPCDLHNTPIVANSRMNSSSILARGTRKLRLLPIHKLPLRGSRSPSERVTNTDSLVVPVGISHGDPLNVPVVRSPITCLHRNHSPKQTHPNPTMKLGPITRDAKDETGVRAVNVRQVAIDGIGSHGANHGHTPPTLPPVILPLTISATELTSDRWSDHRRMERQIRLPITRHRPVSLRAIQAKTDVHDIAADDAETESSTLEPRAVARS